MNYARIIARYRPALVQFAKLESMSLADRLDAIFTIFEDKLDLVPILDDEDISTLVEGPTEYEARAVRLFLSDIYHLFNVSSQIVDAPEASFDSVPQEDRWAVPQTLEGRDDILIEWFSDVPALQHVETELNSDLVPDIQLEFASFMESMLNRAWMGQGFRKLSVVEANSYDVHADMLRRIVFIVEPVSDNLDDDDCIILVGFSTEEHGERADPNKRHRTYLQYLSSSCLESKEHHRSNPTIAQAALISYARWLELTYRSSYFHIWVDPPDKETPEYMFRNCSKNVRVPWSERNKEEERRKLLSTYQRIFGSWDLQSYVWRPEIHIPPQFEEDFKYAYSEYEDVNVRAEVEVFLRQARSLSERLNKYFEKRTLVVYLSEVTILAKDLNNGGKIRTVVTGDTEALLEVGVEDITPLCPHPLLPELLASNLVESPELNFAKEDNQYIESSKKILELVRRQMSAPDMWTRDEHQRAKGILDVEDE